MEHTKQATGTSFADFSVLNSNTGSQLIKEQHIQKSEGKLLSNQNSILSQLSIRLSGERYLGTWRGSKNFPSKYHFSGHSWGMCATRNRT